MMVLGTRDLTFYPQIREVLRTQLDELLSQGVISPVSETDSFPITSPILLVAKRNPMDLMLPRVRRLTLLQTGLVVILDILTFKHLIFLSTYLMYKSSLSHLVKQYLI